MDKYTKKSSVFHSPAYFLHNLSHIASPRLPAFGFNYLLPFKISFPKRWVNSDFVSWFKITSSGKRFL